jgi:plastocyanin
MRRPQFQAVHAGALAAVLSFATVTALSADDVTSIGVIKNENGKFVFTNPNVTVKEGQTVRWVAVDEAGVHQLVPDTDADAMSETDTFDSTNTVSQKFPTAGTINYHCAVHPKSMRGTITVTAAKASEEAEEAPVEEKKVPKKAKPKAKGSYGSYGYSY